MYFRIISAFNQIDHDIIANNPDDAIMIARSLYPNTPLTIVKITHQEFHVPRHSN